MKKLFFFKNKQFYDRFGITKEELINKYEITEDSDDEQETYN